MTGPERDLHGVPKAIGPHGQPVNEMDAANLKDMREHRRMMKLHRAIRELLADTPERLAPTTRMRLEGALRGLEDDCARIVRVWE